MTAPKTRKTSDASRGLAALAKLPQITPEHVDLIRAKVLSLVAENLETATSVLAGKTHWSAAQAGLFKTLLNKVLPDLSQSHATVDHRLKSARELSLEELKAIAAGLYDPVPVEDREIPAITTTYDEVVASIVANAPTDVPMRDTELPVPDADVLTPGGAGVPSADGSPAQRHLPDVSNIPTNFQNLG